jgi:hypothetical protein
MFCISILSFISATHVLQMVQSLELKPAKLYLVQREPCNENVLVPRDFKIFIFRRHKWIRESQFIISRVSDK